MTVSLRNILKTIKQTGNNCSWDFIKNNGITTDNICATTEELVNLENVFKPSNRVLSRRNNLNQKKINGIINIIEPNEKIGDTTRNKVVGEIRELTYNDCNGNIVCAFKKAGNHSNLKNIEDNIRPPPPEHYKGWLSDLDIRRVMKSVKRLYDDFDFIGPDASDWDKYDSQLKLYDFEKAYNNKIRRIGIIFNLDVHTGPGTHWVAMMIDVNRPPTVGYYNSFGIVPPSSIKRFISKISKIIKKLIGEKVTLYINRTKQQHENRECGVYSINYILRRIDNDSAEKISSGVISDDSMKKKRSVIFTSNST